MTVLLVPGIACGIPTDVDSSVKNEELQAVLDSEEVTARAGYYSLKNCEDLARTNNFDLKRAVKSIEENFGIRMEERAAVLPALTGQGAYSKVDKDRLPKFDGGSFGTDESWQAGVELAQPIFLGGGGIAHYDKGSLAVKAAQHAYDAVLNRVITEVRVRFYDVLLSRSRVKVQAESVGLLERELELERQKQVAGVVPEFNVLRAEVAVANSKTPLIRARNDLRLALEELGLVIGLPNDNAAEVKAALKIVGKLSYTDQILDLPAAMKHALDRRPELKELELIREIEERDLKIERSEYLPKLYAVAGYDFESSRFQDSLSEVDHGWRYGLRAEWKIFDSFRTRGRVRQQAAQKASVEVAIEETRKKIEIEVRQALSDLLEAQELVSASKKVVEQAKESLRQASARFHSGAGRQIEVLDTQVALTEARTNQVEALHAFAVAHATLDQATAATLDQRDNERVQ